MKIVAPVALGQLHLVEAALKFQTEHPKVSITWLLEDAPIRFAELGCDLWIKIGQPEDDTLIVRQIASVKRLIVASPDLLDRFGVSKPGDLADLPCAALGPFEGSTNPLCNDQGQAETVSASVTLAMNNIFSSYKAALMGVGYAVMPHWFVGEDPLSGRVAWLASP